MLIKRATTVQGLCGPDVLTDALHTVCEEEFFNGAI